MDQAQIEALLGRSLTPRESTNLKLYLDIALKELETLLCISVSCPEVDTRIYEAREGMRTVFTGIFTDVSEVKVNGDAVTDYYKAFWDNRNGSFYNSIVFDTAPDGEVEITADWGFDNVPNDFRMLIARMFAIVSKKRKPGSGNIKSKQTEDFRITYGDLTDDDEFTRDNATTISKYGMCKIGYIIHGEVCKQHRVRQCGYCL